jgi:hypothetical protein
VQGLRGQLNLQRFGATKFQSELQNRQKPAWPIHDKACSGWTAFVRMLNRGPGAFLRIASIRCNLQFARHRQQTANCAEKTRRFPDQMADIQRSGKLALLSLRPWRLALVTQLLALQAPPGAKSALVCAVDGRFSANTDSNPITNNTASAQAVRLTAPRRTSSRKAFRMRGRSTMSVVFYQSKSLSRCFESVVSIVACSYILTDGRAVGALIGVDKSIVCRTRRIGDRPGAARALRNRRLEV